jgi:diguanylate cyclase (GGDEF)-like protein
MTIALFLSYRGKNKALSCIAFSDPVTGGLSETKFHFDAEKLIRSAPSKTYTLAMVDVKNFKLINETFGSDNGDRLLRYIHDALSRLIGEGELVCRTFADDYALLLKNRDQQAIMALAEQISTEINRFNSQRSINIILPLLWAPMKSTTENCRFCSSKIARTLPARNRKFI